MLAEPSAVGSAGTPWELPCQAELSAGKALAEYRRSTLSLQQVVAVDFYLALLLGGH